MSACHFILAEDRAQSRTLKRQLAEKGAWLNLMVGTWTELLAHLQNLFLLEAPPADWSALLAAAADETDGAFWRESLKVAPAETLACLDGELQRLLLACGPGNSLDSFDVSALSARGASHFHDLAALHDQMGRVLPPDLALVQSLLIADPVRSLKAVVIYDGFLQAPPNPWQKRQCQYTLPQPELPSWDEAYRLRP